MRSSRADSLANARDGEPPVPRVGGPCPCCGDTLGAGERGAPACGTCRYPANNAAWVAHDGC